MASTDGGPGKHWAMRKLTAGRPADPTSRSAASFVDVAGRGSGSSSTRAARAVGTSACPYTLVLLRETTHRTPTRPASSSSAPVASTFDGAELPVLDPADVRRVQSGGVDHRVGAAQRGLTYPGVAEVTDDAGPFARYPVGSASRPAAGVEGRRDRRSEARPPGPPSSKGWTRRGSWCRRGGSPGFCLLPA